MKILRAAGALLALAGLTLRAQSRFPTQQLTDALPDQANIEQFVLTLDGQRTYYTTTSGDVWRYDRSRKTSDRISTATVWDLNVSPLGDALVYTKAGDTRQEQHVWLLPIDPRTGLASGSDRRLSTQPGDVPTLSPDGKWVAFARDDATGVGQSLVVVPAAGGSERVVAPALPSGIGNIRWTPDGTVLFFGVNPPVACVPDWSCLPLSPNRRPGGTIRRVALSGGLASVVATTPATPLPGLSPDGTRLVYPDAGRTRQFVVADTSGRRLETFTLSASQSIQGWLRSSTLLNLSGGAVRRLRATPLGGGPSRIVFDSSDAVFEPSWLPDGSRISYFLHTGERCELRVIDSSGAPARTVQLPGTGCGTPGWTVDQQKVVFTSYRPNQPPAITLVDIATGQSKVLHELTKDFQSIDWVIDGDELTIAERAEPLGHERRAALRRADFNGNSTLVRELTVASEDTIVPFTRSSAVILSANRRNLKIVPLDGVGAAREIQAPQNGAPDERPWLSIDKRWLAFRIAPSNSGAQTTVFELVRLDGAARQTIEFPFVLRDRLQFAVSSDGRQMVSFTQETLTPSVSTMDLSAPRTAERR